MRFLLLPLLTLVGACRVDALDVTGKPCPCPSDWVCDPGSQTCQRSASELDGSDDGVVDASFDLVSGLLYHYKFDQASGQAVPDSAPTNRRGHACSATDTMWRTGVRGNALHFNGTEYASFVLFPATTCSCGAAEQITGSFSTSLWVQFDSFHGYNGYTLGDVAAMHGTAGGQEGGWGIGASDACGTTTASVTITSPGNGPRVNRCGTTPLAVATWYHLTGVYDASARTLDIYVNGVKDSGALTPSSPAVPTSINAPPATCPYIGSSANQNSLLYGSVDEFRLYNRALSSAEVAELYRVSQ